MLTAAAGNPLALIELPKLDGSVTDAWPSVALAPDDGSARATFAFRASQLEGRSADLLLLAALNDSDRVSELVQAASLLRGEPVDVHDLEPAVDAGLWSSGGRASASATR